MSKVEYREFSLDKIIDFTKSITNGSEFTKTLINKNKATIPVYGASNDENEVSYGYVKDENGKTSTCSILDKKTTPVVKKYEYKYEKKVEAEYSAWSNWSDNKTYKDSDNIVWGKQELVWNEKMVLLKLM